MTQYTPLRPLATVLAWQAQLEADGTNPKGNEPLTVGSGFPPGYDPHAGYTWTSVKVLALYDDEGAEIPILNPPSAAIVMPELHSGYGSGWAQAQVITLEPGLVPADFDTTAAVFFTDPMPMADGIALADQVDAGGGPPRNDVIRIPRPLDGEQPTENDATWIVLAISDASQQNDFPQGMHWNTYLPKVERGHFAGIQNALYARVDGANVVTQGQSVVSVEDTIPDSLRAVADLGDVILAAPSSGYRPRLNGPALALFPPQRLQQNISPMCAALTGVDTATIYCVAKFAQLHTSEFAWSLGAGANDYWAMFWSSVGTIVAQRHSDDHANAPFTQPDFSVFAFRGNGAAAPQMFIDGLFVGTGAAGQPSSALAGGTACLGALMNPTEVADTSMQGEIAEWTVCLAAHSDAQIDTKSNFLRQYWQSRGLTFNPLAAVPFGGP